MVDFREALLNYVQTSVLSYHYEMDYNPAVLVMQQSHRTACQGTGLAFAIKNVRRSFAQDCIDRNIGNTGERCYEAGARCGGSIF